MANVGDLFINVRAKTSGLTKGLRSARGSLANFARSGTAMIAGIGAGFGIFKGLQFIMGSLIGHSAEFRESWAKIQTQVNQIGQEFAKEFGPALAKGISDLSEWLATSEAVHDTFRGMGETLTLLRPITNGLAKSFNWWQKQAEEGFNYLFGVREEMAKVRGPISPEELRALSVPRSGPAGEARALGAQRATSRDYLNAEMLKYQKRIAERVEIPK